MAHEVRIVHIDSVMPHPNADRLDLVQVKGWQCVTQKDKYGAGDPVIYIPIDSVLSADTEIKLFPPESKIRLHNRRIKTIKIRGAISQGMIVDPYLFFDEHCLGDFMNEDLSPILGISKYEPPVKDIPVHMQGKATTKKVNPNFKHYTDINNFKHYNNAFVEGEPCYISAKLHGTSARYAVYPTEVNSLWKKFLKLIHLLPENEFCYGSRRVQLQNKLLYTGYYKDNVYAKIAKKLDLENILQPGEALYGEIVGEGIQKGYHYGCYGGYHEFYAYDVMVNGKWLDYKDFAHWCDIRRIKRVPELYIGPYSFAKADELRQGDEDWCNQKVKEGVVIKPLTEQTSYMGRKVLKLINDLYLLNDNTEFH